MEGTMKAARLHEFESTHGAQEVVRAEEIPIPDIDRGEVLVRVLRAGLNHGDVHMRTDGVPYTPDVKMMPFLPMTIGHDGLGEVVEVGPDVSTVRAGDRVVVMCSLTCGYCKYCRSERQDSCSIHRVMGFEGYGARGVKRTGSSFSGFDEGRHRTTSLEKEFLAMYPFPV